MRVGVVGINHKLADLKLREELARACQQSFGRLQVVHYPHQFVLLSTCNRTEIYFSSHDLIESHSYVLKILREKVKKDFDHKLYSFFGLNCFIHLARVTLGLDSAIIAETEIQGQVKMAYEGTLEYQILPSEMHFLFQKSLGIAKKLRSDLQLGRGMPNLEHAVLQTGKQTFEDPPKKKLLFVGISQINQKILTFLKNRNFENITLCNRTDCQGIKIADEYRICYLPWGNLECWTQFDWIIFGTKSPDFLIKKIPHRLDSQKLVIDLSVPRNVDPQIGQNENVLLMNIDQINRQLKIRSHKMTESLAAAEKLLLKMAHEHVNRYILKQHQNRDSKFGVWNARCSLIS